MTELSPPVTNIHRESQSAAIGNVASLSADAGALNVETNRTAERRDISRLPLGAQVATSSFADVPAPTLEDSSWHESLVTEKRVRWRFTFESRSPDRPPQDVIEDNYLERDEQRSPTPTQSNIASHLKSIRHTVQPSEDPVDTWIDRPPLSSTNNQELEPSSESSIDEAQYASFSTVAEFSWEDPEASKATWNTPEDLEGDQDIATIASQNVDVGNMVMGVSSGTYAPQNHPNLFYASNHGNSPSPSLAHSSG